MMKECPNCLNGNLEIFYKTDNVPVQSVKLLETKNKAIEYSRGNIHLGFCRECGFISNTLFDFELLNYSESYESTQSCSPTFNAFHYQLAYRLINKFNLQNKRVLEIGCGQGEFLQILCDNGNMTGTGFDPAIDMTRNIVNKNKIKLIPDYYSEKYHYVQADFVCCKMTLEHIPHPYGFLSVIFQSLSENKDQVIFFQVPSANRILEDFAFWDIYYEHCSYFTIKALTNLFRKSGFSIQDIWVDYDHQYLMVSATKMPSLEYNSFNSLSKEEVDFLYQFGKKVQDKASYWSEKIEKETNAGKKVVLWGSGSKAVSFLNTLKISESVLYVVDINPLRQNTYIAGTGQQIVSPEFLINYKPDLIIVMNPVYHKEISADLKQLNVKAQIMSLQ